MILPYDPFGAGRMVYTVKNQCVEKRDMQYEDGARTIFLYTNGTEDKIEYMKIFEREQMLIKQGRMEEQKKTEAERQKVEAERQRAEKAEAEKEKAVKEVEKLRRIIEEMSK